MLYKIYQQVIAKTPIGTKPGTIIDIEVLYTVKLDSGLIFKVKEPNLNRWRPTLTTNKGG